MVSTNMVFKLAEGLSAGSGHLKPFTPAEVPFWAVNHPPATYFTGWKIDAMMFTTLLPRLQKEGAKSLFPATD